MIKRKIIHLFKNHCIFFLAFLYFLCICEIVVLVRLVIIADHVFILVCNYTLLTHKMLTIKYE